MNLLHILTVLSLWQSASAIQTSLSYQVQENSPSNTVIANLLTDAGFSDEYSEDVIETLDVSFVDSSVQGADIFKIQNHQLLTALYVDREYICVSVSECAVNLDVQVSSPQLFNIIKVSIILMDRNDNIPSFDSGDVVRTISESSNPGSIIPLPLATDLDSPENGIVGYGLTDTSGKFELIETNTSSGIQAIYLSLLGKLDREVKEVYLLEVEAIDAKGQSGSMIVTVQVQDANDNVPVFTKASYAFQFPENVEEGFIIGQLSANDIDSGENSIIVYEITDESMKDIFELNSSSGVLSLQTAVDRDAVPLYSFQISAKNPDPNSLPTYTTVKISLEDINDNSPEAKVRGSSDGKSVKISEKVSVNSFVAHITVTDLDNGQNGTFNCSVQSRNFALIELIDKEYKLETKHILDRETQPVFNVDINCADHGIPTLRSSKTVTIVVGDENDNAPKFAKSVYSGSLLENNKPGDFIVQVVASDPDEGQNGLVTYAFDDDSLGLLRIDPESGDIYANISFDHEIPHHRRIEATVKATDHGDEPLISRVTVIVNVIDVDDEQPKFDKPIYKLGVFENQQIQTEVGVVEAHDDDSELFSRFYYELDFNQEDANSFTIDSTTGQIYSTEVFDREFKSEYHFTVSAISEGLHPKTDTTSVHVYIADVNDNSPVIHFPNFKNNTVHISNRTPQTTVLATVEADDMDSNTNAQISYSIISGNSQGFFTINKYSGVVSLDKDVDHIQHKLFGLVIEAEDHGNPPRASEAYLNIIVNKSLSAPSTGLMSNHNLTIVIAIATVSGILMVVLVVGIAMILRYPVITSCTSKQRNQKALNMLRNDIEAAKDAVTVHNDLGLAPTSRQGNADLSFVNLSFHEDTRDLLSQQESHMKQIGHQNDAYLASMEKDTLYASVSPHSSHTSMLPPRDYPRRVSKSQSDSDSSCSGDANTTDSGRGSHGSNEDALHDKAASPRHKNGGIQQPPPPIYAKLPPKLHRQNAATSHSQCTSPSNNYQDNRVYDKPTKTVQGAVSNAVHV